MKPMLFRPLKNDHGVALVFMVLLFAAAATASVVFIALGVKLKGIQNEGGTQARLGEIRTALQNYYLIHYNLPDPSKTTPVNSVPTNLLNLPQKYRFDSNGQMIYYNRKPESGRMTTVRNIQVHSDDPEDLVAAVLVAAGPDKSIDPENRPPQAPPYDDLGNDDIVLAISLEAEALKIVSHTVAVLQQAAKAYDSIFLKINNDIDTLYPPPKTRWVDLTPPSSVQVWQKVGEVSEIGVGGVVVVTSVYGWVDDATGALHNNYSGDPITTYHNDGTTTTLTAIPPGDEYVESVRRPDVPQSIINENGYVAAEGGVGLGCVKMADVKMADVTLGQVLTNDPDRGVASLDLGLCTNDQPAYDLAVAYGLNLIKLGYDAASGLLLDPWGHQYLWGVPPGGLPPTNRDRYSWTFYSWGPDGQKSIRDDILPPADRIPDYNTTPIPTPIP